MRTRRQAIGALVTAFGLLAPCASAHAQNAFSFSDGTTPAQLIVPNAVAGATASTTVILVNGRDRSVDLKLKVEPLMPSVLPAGVYAAAEEIRLARSSSEPIELRLQTAGAMTPPGTYLGTLVASGQYAGRDTVLRKEIQLHVGPLAEQPEVLVNARQGPPLDGEITSPTSIPTVFASDGRGTGTLVDADGDSVPVWASNSKGYVRLHAENVSGGVYRGVIDFGDNGTVHVTLDLSDWFVWPLLALVLGVALAWAARRYVRGDRLLERRHVVQQAKAALDAARDIGGLIESQLKPRLDGAANRRSLPSGAGSAQETEILAELTENLKRLKSALDELGDVRVPEPLSPDVAGWLPADDEKPGLPSFLRPAADPDDGSTSLDALTRQNLALGHALSVVEAWPGIAMGMSVIASSIRSARDAGNDPVRVISIPPEREDEPSVLDEIASRYDRLVLRLRLAGSADEIDLGAILDALRELQEDLATAVTNTTGARLLPVPVGPRTVERRPSEQARVPIAVVRVEARRRTVLSLLSSVVVVLLGLVVLYSDGLFSSPADYLAGILWGLFGKLALDGLLTFAERAVVVRADAA